MKLIRKIIFNFKFSVWNWWWYDLYYPVCNFFHYLPVLWSDRSWEFIGLYQLMEKKLEQMEKQHMLYGNHTSCPRIARDIHRTRLALKRIIDDKYLENVFYNHNKKWGRLDIDFERKGSAIFRPNIRSPKDDIQESIEYSRLVKRVDILEDQDFDYVFRMLKKHSRGWWD